MSMSAKRAICAIVATLALGVGIYLLTALPWWHRALLASSAGFLGGGLAGHVLGHD